MTTAQMDAIEDLKEENAKRGLTLATLCDMVLGEDATDRTDDALIRRVRFLLDEREKIADALKVIRLEDGGVPDNLADFASQLMLEEYYPMAKKLGYFGDDK